METKTSGLKSKLIVVALSFALCVLSAHTQSPAPANGKKPNILVIFGDDVGQTNISAYGFGVVGYKTPNLDRLAHEGMMFTDYYAENRRPKSNRQRRLDCQ